MTDKTQEEYSAYQIMYPYGDKSCAVQIQATSMADAENRLKCIGSGKVVGKIKIQLNESNHATGAELAHVFME